MEYNNFIKTEKIPGYEELIDDVDNLTGAVSGLSDNVNILSGSVGQISAELSGKADGTIYTVNSGKAVIVGGVSEGYGTDASGYYSHSEGLMSKAIGIGSHAEGGGIISMDSQEYTVPGGIAEGSASHAEGISIELPFEFVYGKSGIFDYTCTIYGYAAKNVRDVIGFGSVIFTLNNNEVDSVFTILDVSITQASDDSPVVVNLNLLNGPKQTFVGYCATMSRAIGQGSHTEGSSLSFNIFSHSEDAASTVCSKGDGGHAEGWQSLVIGEHAWHSHAENHGIATGNYSHSEGYVDRPQDDFGETNRRQVTFVVNNVSGGEASGYFTYQIGNGVPYTDFGFVYNNERYDFEYIYGFGQNGYVYYQFRCSSDVLSSVGDYTAYIYVLGGSQGDYSHSEGYTTTAAGQSSHSEGNATIAFGPRSHTEGEHTIAIHANEHAEGKYNKTNILTTSSITRQTIHSTGIGTSNNDRKNAFEIMDNGDVYVYGVGDYDGKNPATATRIQDSFIKLKSLMQSDYDTLVSTGNVVESTIYKTTDTNKIYMGSILLA